MLNILCDEKIPFAREAFGDLGNVTLGQAGRITSRDLKNVDVLIIRSGTRVDAALLDGTPVHFVATATAGIDHVDVDYLRDRGIPFYHAPGCNAESVVEYVIAGLYYLADKKRETLNGKIVGIVGAGNVGGRLVRRLPILGFQVLVNDPPLLEREPARAEAWDTVSLDELLRRADIVTLHVPMTNRGAHPTHHLIGENELRRMKSGAWLINAARGGVVSNIDLLRAFEEGCRGATILDVWENEPIIDTDLFRHVEIGTAHIAGHSYEGKVNGTIQIYEAFTRHFGYEGRWDPRRILEPGPEDRLDLSMPGQGLDTVSGWHTLVRQMYDIKADDCTFRKVTSIPPDKRGDFFLDCRRFYPRRRSFAMFTLRLDSSPDATTRAVLVEGLGIRVM